MLGVEPVARPKKGVKVPERRSVKIDRIICGQVEMVAKSRGMAISDCLDEMLRPIAAREFAKLVKLTSEQEGGK